MFAFTFQQTSLIHFTSWLLAGLFKEVYQYLGACLKECERELSFLKAIRLASEDVRCNIKELDRKVEKIEREYNPSHDSTSARLSESDCHEGPKSLWLFPGLQVTNVSPNCSRTAPPVLTNFVRAHPIFHHVFVKCWSSCHPLRIWDLAKDARRGSEMSKALNHALLP